MKYPYKFLNHYSFGKLIALIPVVAILFSSCDYNEYSHLKSDDYTPDFATQLVHADLNLGSMVAERVKDKSLGVDSTNPNHPLYFLTASSTRYSDPLEKALSIPLNQKPVNIRFDFPAPIPAVKDSLTKVYTVNVGDSAVATASSKRDLKYLLLKGGKANFNITSGKVDTKLKGTLIFNGIAMPGGPDLSVDFIIDSAVTNTVLSVDLNGYGVKFDNTQATKNSLTVKLKVTPASSGGTISAGGFVNAAISLSEFKIKYVEGYLGKFILSKDFADTLALKFFNSIFDKDNKIYIANPKLEANVFSSVGMPCILQIGNVHTYSATGVQKTLIVNPGIKVGDLDYPLIKSIPAADRAGFGPLAAPPSLNLSPTIYSKIDSNNTNIAQAIGPISQAPNRIGYTLGLTSDSTQISTSQWGFDTSRIAFSGKVTLPLNGRVYHFGIQDYVDVNFPSYDANSQIDSITLKVAYRNGLPVEGAANLYFVKDTTYTVLRNGTRVTIDTITKVDSLTKMDINDQAFVKTDRNNPFNFIMTGAPTDANGYVNQNTVNWSSPRYFGMSASRYKRIIQSGVSKAFFKCLFVTTAINANKNVKFTTDEGIKIRVGIRVKAHIKSTKLN